MTNLRSGITILLAALTCFSLTACRDKEPTPSLYVDLGDDKRALPPPPKSPWLDTSLKSGRAEWQPFREPSSNPPSNENPADASASAPSTGGGVMTPEVASRVESEIRVMLTNYNAAAAEGRTEELLDFYVLDQVDVARTLFELGDALQGKMAGLEQVLSAKLADQGDRIGKVFEPLRQANSRELKVGTIEVQSDTSATGSLTGTPIPAKIAFAVEEDAWYIRLPPDVISAMQASANAIMPLFDQFKAGLESGQVPAEQALAAFEQVTAQLTSGGGDDATVDGSPKGTQAAELAGTSAAKAIADTTNEPSPELLKVGADAYTSAFCLNCHGQDGTGGPRAPDLTDGEWVHCDGSIEGILDVLKSGVAQGDLVDTNFPFAMNPATNFINDDETLLALATYVHSLSK